MSECPHCYRAYATYLQPPPSQEDHIMWGILEDEHEPGCNWIEARGAIAPPQGRMRRIVRVPPPYDSDRLVGRKVTLTADGKVKL